MVFHKSFFATLLQRLGCQLQDSQSLKFSHFAITLWNCLLRTWKSPFRAEDRFWNRPDTKIHPSTWTLPLRFWVRFWISHYRRHLRSLRFRGHRICYFWKCLRTRNLSLKWAYPFSSPPFRRPLGIDIIVFSLQRFRSGGRFLSIRDSKLHRIEFRIISSNKYLSFSDRLFILWFELIRFPRLPMNWRTRPVLPSHQWWNQTLIFSVVWLFTWPWYSYHSTKSK